MNGSTPAEIEKKYTACCNDNVTTKYKAAFRELTELYNLVRKERDEARAMGITLTIEQIKELAEFTGMKVTHDVTDEDKETEITITKCPENGVDDDGSIVHCKHIVYFEEYPDEGVCPLGPTTLEFVKL